MLLLRVYCALVREVDLAFAGVLSLSVPMLCGHPTSWYLSVPYRSSCEVSSPCIVLVPPHVYSSELLQVDFGP